MKRLKSDVRDHKIKTSSGKNQFFVKINKLINFGVIIFLLLLPYSLFEGKMFLGGDDTRLFYVFPKEYLSNIPFFSWTNLSSVGWNFSYQSFLPFVELWALISEFISSKIVLSYLSLSLPLILGFVFIQKLIKVLLDDDHNSNMEIILGALFYIFSPIIIHNHFLNPLIPIWLIGLIPAVSYYFLNYLKQGKVIDILKAVILVSVFSFGSHNIPWAAGFILPIFISLSICASFYSRRDIIYFLRKLLIFFSVIAISQSFWLFGFILSVLLGSENSVTAKVLSEDFGSVFSKTVEATSTGNIIYPLLNLFHRQIAFDFEWNLKDIFTNYYDKTYFINTIYLIVLFLGIRNIKESSSKFNRKKFIFILVAFATSLYLFTVNIGPLKDFFIFLGNIPGFIIFRNAYDKMAIGFTLIYSILITFCLVIIRRKLGGTNIKYFAIITIFAVSILVNLIPIKKIIVSPLWTTENIYKNITIPDEYLAFMKLINSNISSTNNILSVPYGISLYTVVKDETSDSVYAGVSPIVILSGVNDISGYLSFNYGPSGKAFDEYLIDRNYLGLNNILYDHNINYVLLTKNIPKEVLDSFLFSREHLEAQDTRFLSSVTDKKIASSANDNYELYTTKKRNSLLSSDNLIYKKVSRVKYELQIKNIKSKQELLFNDSFHDGWVLYPDKFQKEFPCDLPLKIDYLKTTECKQDTKYLEAEDINFIFKKPVFDNSHKVHNGISNSWIIDSNLIKNNFEKNAYKVNADGSVDLQLTLYFKPQLYFYIGSLISIITLTLLVVIALYRRYDNKNK